jgi:hypothetical protein
MKITHKISNEGDTIYAKGSKGLSEAQKKSQGTLIHKLKKINQRKSRSEADQHTKVIYFGERIIHPFLNSPT